LRDYPRCDLAWTQGRDHELLDVGAEAIAIHWTVKRTGCADLIDAKRGNEGRRFPMAPRHAGDKTLTARAAAITSCHVGRGTGFVDEDQACRVQFALAGMPLGTGRGDVRPVLLGGALCLFLSGSFKRRSLFHRHPMLTLTSRSATSHLCSSSSVASG
jgi:hypothetical protein